MAKLMLSSDEILRYSRQIALKEIGLSGQEQLKNARVLCVGLGGLGSSFLLYLAAAGVGKLGLVDADQIEISNLQRQVLYQNSQVSRSKAVCAKEQLLALNPTIDVQIYEEKLGEDNAAQLMSPYHLVADCTDNFDTNYLLHDFCFRQRKAYVYASISQFQGYCSVFYGKENPCLRCLFPFPLELQRFPSCNEAGVLGVVAGVMGTIQATECIKWLLKIGQSLHKRLLIADLLTMTFKKVRLTRNPDCQLCVHNQAPIRLHLSAANYSIRSTDLPSLLKNPLVTLVDVRSKEEHEAHNIGGKLLPLPELASRINELNPEHHILLYCHSGQRSILALNLLLEAGFTSVKYLLGGIMHRLDLMPQSSI